MNSFSGAKEPEPTFVAEETRKPLGRREVATGFAWNASMNVAVRVVLMAAQIVFYRLLGPGPIGIYSAMVPIYMICESLRDAGLALTYIADRDAHGSREGQYATLAMLNAIVFAAIIFFARGLVVRLFGHQEFDWGLQMVALAVLLTGFSTVPANKLQKKARFRDAGMIDLGSSVLSAGVAFVLVFQGFGYKALIWQFVLRSAFFTMGCWLVEPVKFAKIHASVVKAVGKHASHNLLNNFSFTFYTVADNLMVLKLFGPVALGNYNAAYTFGMKPVDFFGSPLAKTLLIAYSRKSHDLEALTNAFVRTICITLLAMAPVYALVGAFAKPLTVMLLSQRFQGAGALLAILVIYCGFRSVGLLCGNALVAMNKPVLNFYGWVCAYAVVASVLFFNRGHLALPLVVEALTAGAVTVYSVTSIAAFSILRPQGENARKLWRALGLSALSVAIACAATWLPFRGLVNCGLGAVLIGVVQLLGVGAVYAKSPRACFSKAGLKQISAAI